MLTYSFILFSVVLLFNMIIAMLSKTFNRSMHDLHMNMHMHMHMRMHMHVICACACAWRRTCMCKIINYARLHCCSA